MKKAKEGDTPLNDPDDQSWGSQDQSSTRDDQSPQPLQPEPPATGTTQTIETGDTKVQVTQKPAPTVLHQGSGNQGYGNLERDNARKESEEQSGKEPTEPSKEDQVIP